MKPISQYINYSMDILYNVLLNYPNGITRPHVWKGYFQDNELGECQKKLFDLLIEEEGFKRTPFQIIFPKQTAGLIKKIPQTGQRINEVHVRFYNDGVIDCELEADRFNYRHFINERINGGYYLENIVRKNASISADEKEKIIAQFGNKDYSKFCMRNIEINPTYAMALLLGGLWFWEYVIGSIFWDVCCEPLFLEFLKK